MPLVQWLLQRRGHSITVFTCIFVESAFSFFIALYRVDLSDNFILRCIAVSAYSLNYSVLIITMMAFWNRLIVTILKIGWWSKGSGYHFGFKSTSNIPSQVTELRKLKSLIHHIILKYRGLELQKQSTIHSIGSIWI